MHTLARRNPSQTDTAESSAPSSAAFRRWFGASEVVDEQGQPLVVYHGTTAGGFDAFRPNYRKGEQLGFGIHFAQDRGFAAKYAEDPTVARKGKTPKVYAVYLSIQRPLVADAIVYEGTPEFALAKKLAGSKLMTQRGEDGVRMAYMQNAIDQTSAQRAEKLIREAGYDGIVYEAQLASHTGMGWAKTGSSRSFIVFDPTQVKSATDNAGTFDPAEPSIYRNPAPRNSMRRRNPSDLERARAGDKNLEGSDLYGASLYNADLREANLKGANLREANLGNANLQGANLEGANLEGANLKGVYLRNAILNGANLREAGLEDAHLASANLHGADLYKADLREANLGEADLLEANLKGADLYRVNLRYAELINANLQIARLVGANLFAANLRDANLEGANLKGASIREAYLAGVNLKGADLEGAVLQDANLQNANLEDANLEGADLEGANVKGTVLEPPTPRPARSYGRQTGAVLKMGKPDAPSKAADFKKKYPAEFERLKGDTAGRDLSDSLRAQVRKKYETPFSWLVTEGRWESSTQRFCADPNLVFKFNIDLTDAAFTERQREAMTRLAETSRRSGHPHEIGNLFTVGWVRLCVDDAAKTWLVEEVQSDVGVVRSKLKDGSAPAGLEEYADVIRDLQPYLDRFYEDALGVVFMEAEQRDYAVEMLTYNTKKFFGSPRNVYEDLPRSMGMTKQKGSKSLQGRIDEVWFYKPNPRRRGLDVRPGIEGTYLTRYTAKGGGKRAYPTQGGAAWDRTLVRVANETTVASARVYDTVKRAERAGRATVRGKRGAVEVLRVTNPAPDAEPLVFYHGAQRWEGTPSIVAHRKGHAEHGAGIYLTTSWTTASNYAKGGGSVYRFEVAPDVGWLEDARLPVAETVRWVKSLPRLKGKADIVATLERVAGRVGPSIPAETLVVAFVNFGASAGQHGPSLAEYLVAHGIDASHVSRSVNEDWVVVFNPAKVLRVTRVPARERGEGFVYDLPRVKRKNPSRRTSSRRNPRAACPTKLMKYEYLGTTDEVTTCDCCGKTNLKNTVAIRDLDEGEVLHFGVTCAARALKVQVADVKKGAADADRQRREEEFRRRDAENRANTALWHEWLIERTGGIYEYDRSPDVFRMIQALGGMAAARVGFEEWKAAKKARSNPRRGGRR